MREDGGGGWGLRRLRRGWRYFCGVAAVTDVLLLLVVVVVVVGFGKYGFGECGFGFGVGFASGWTS